MIIIIVVCRRDSRRAKEHFKVHMRANLRDRTKRKRTRSAVDKFLISFLADQISHVEQRWVFLGGLPLEFRARGNLPCRTGDMCLCVNARLRDDECQHVWKHLICSQGHAVVSAKSIVFKRTRSIIQLREQEPGNERNYVAAIALFVQQRATSSLDDQRSNARPMSCRILVICIPVYCC